MVVCNIMMKVVYSLPVLTECQVGQRLYLVGNRLLVGKHEVATQNTKTILPIIAPHEKRRCTISVATELIAIPVDEVIAPKNISCL